MLIYFGVTRPDLQMIHGSNGLGFEHTFSYFLAVVPAEQNPLWNFISYQFVHASLGHLLSNMWYLIIFGWILENALGSRKFLLFSLLAGAAAVLPEFIVQKNAELPIVGASGSVAFMMGAVFLLFPRAKLKLLFLLIPLPNTPASFFVPLRYLIYFWVSIQVSGLAFHHWVEPRPVAYATHLTGFALGMVIGVAYYFATRRDFSFVDIDLAGGELRKFYDGLKALQKRDFEVAQRELESLSDRNPWMLNLQMQLLRVSIKNQQKELSYHIWKNALTGLFALKKQKQAKESVDSLIKTFGALPELEIQERVQLKQLLGLAPESALSELSKVVNKSS